MTITPERLEELDFPTPQLPPEPYNDGTLIFGIEQAPEALPTGAEITEALQAAIAVVNGLAPMFEQIMTVITGMQGQMSEMVAEMARMRLLEEDRRPLSRRERRHHQARTGQQQRYQDEVARALGVAPQPNQIREPRWQEAQQRYQQYVDYRTADWYSTWLCNCSPHRGEVLQHRAATEGQPLPPPVPRSSGVVVRQV